MDSIVDFFLLCILIIIGVPCIIIASIVYMIWIIYILIHDTVFFIINKFGGMKK